MIEYQHIKVTKSAHKTLNVVRAAFDLPQGDFASYQILSYCWLTSPGLVRAIVSMTDEERHLMAHISKIMRESGAARENLEGTHALNLKELKLDEVGYMQDLAGMAAVRLHDVLSTASIAHLKKAMKAIAEEIERREAMEQSDSSE